MPDLLLPPACCAPASKGRTLRLSAVVDAASLGRHATSARSDGDIAEKSVFEGGETKELPRG